MTESASTRAVLLATLGALGVAGALLLTVVLPAEYGWDPLGSGAALGVVGMADDDVAPLHLHAKDWYSDRVSFELAPFESVEYKYRLAQGSTMLYHWRAQAEVLYDMHAEPDGAAPGYAESFDAGRAVSSAGSYTAPFEGIHGWFWQNRGQTTVTVELATTGFYAESFEFRDGREFRYELPQPP